MKKIIITLLALLSPVLGYAQELPNQEISDAHAYIFVRDDCSHCIDLKAFIEKHEIEHTNYKIHYIDIETADGATLFNDATTRLSTGKVTPITLVDNEVFVGFSEKVLGKVLLEGSQKGNGETTPYFEYMDIDTYHEGVGCTEESEVCEEDPKNTEMVLPVVGTINPQNVSLSFLAIALGFVDGFNPCAMWVLLTFLVILSQVGDRKKMIQVAGLFMLAEAVMYYLILNVWYQTWDFIALDRVVTPAVGVLALGSGIFFVYKYFKSRHEALTCDVTSLEHQEKTQNKIKNLISRPMSFVVAAGIIGLALSVNVIEFACSVGIPQAFTKVLELNNLSFLQYQAYTLLYTVFYMVDDLIVFGLAIWGYKKFYAVGQKYSKISTGIAGILMFILGAILIFNPNILSF